MIKINVMNVDYVKIFASLMLVYMGIIMILILVFIVVVVLWFVQINVYQKKMKKAIENLLLLWYTD